MRSFLHAVGPAIALAAAVAGSAVMPARADQYRTQVRLMGQTRTLEVTLNEPGQLDSVALDAQTFDRVYPNSTGGLSADRRIPGGLPTQIETLTILTDAILLRSFRASPYWSAMSMAFANATEVRCDGRSEAILMFTDAGMPRRTLGNCFRFQEGY